MLLLDEIEKAHPDLFNILLQVMDHGKLTDHNGKTVDFRNVILIMTTNAGAARPGQAQPSASAASEREGDDDEAIKRLFTPEFRNRLDAIDHFAGRWTRGSSGRWSTSSSCSSRRSWPTASVTIELTAAARSWLAEKGYDQLFGARPLARVIQEHIKQPLADELLFGRLAQGGTVEVDAADEKLSFSFPG